MAMDSKTALVTGASSGIGKATAERLSMAGFKVYGASRRGVRADQRSFEMLSLDVTSDESVAAAVAQMLHRERRIDLLVNNDEYRDVRAAVGKRLTEMIEEADEPGVVAETVLKASIAANPKLRYTAGGRASRLQLLRTFAPAGMLDAGIRKNLRLAAI